MQLPPLLPDHPAEYKTIRTQPILNSRFVFGLKRLRQNDDGTLELRYWSGLEGLEVPGSEKWGFEGLDLGGGQDLGAGLWNRPGGALRGSCKLVGSAVFLSERWGDFHLSCKLAVGTGSGRGGVVFRYEPESRRGVAVVLDFGKCCAEICGTRTGWRWIGRTVWDRASCSLSPDEPNHLRVFCRAEFAEVYVNDRWIFSTALQETPTVEALEKTPKLGSLGFFVEDGATVFSDFRIAGLEPLP